MSRRLPSLRGTGIQTPGVHGDAVGEMVGRVSGAAAGGRGSDIAIINMWANFYNNALLRAYGWRDSNVMMLFYKQQKWKWQWGRRGREGG